MTAAAGRKRGIGMRVSSDPSAGGAFADLVKLQAEFQTRLAEETMRYVRRLWATPGPTVPGTVLVPGRAAALQASGSPGASAELRLELDNRQRVHCVVTPMLSPLVGLSGVTWFPAAEPVPPLALLAPDEVATLAVRIAVPAGLPTGTYRGALVLQGFKNGAIPVTVTITARARAAAPGRREAGPAPSRKPRKAARRRAAPGTRR